MPARLDFNNIKKEIENDNNFALLSLETEYKNNKSKLNVFHNKCKNIFQIDFDHWKRGQRCPFCNKYLSRKTNDTFLKELKEKQPNKYTILGTYKNKRTKVHVKCNDCGYEMDMFPCNLYSGNCTHCAAKERSIKYKKPTNEINIPKDYLVVGSYINNKTPVEIKHTICQKIFTATTTNLRGGSRCPYCYSRGSIEEEKIKKYLEEDNNIKNIEKYKYVINKKEHIFKEIDMFIKDKNIGFEYDDLYWHSDKFRDSNSHIEKTKFFDNKGIRIVHIFSDEWLNKQEIVKDKIQSILGIQKEKIYARKCEIKEIPSKERNIFLEKNHIQGADKASISYGLLYKNELVAVLSLSKPRIALGQKSNNNSGLYELSRFAGKLGFTIVGGFSKLLKNILKLHPEIKKIITYADIRWTDLHNNVYTKNNFKLDHISEPSYFYIDSNAIKRENRFNYRKQVLKNKFPDIYSDSKSENEIMKEAGYSRIYDCGNLVYTLSI